MMLTELSMAAAYVYGSAKLYRQNKRKKLAWMVPQEKMATPRETESPREAGFPFRKKTILAEARTQIAHGKTALRKFNAYQLRPLFPSVQLFQLDTRRQFLAEVSRGNEANQVSEAEKKANRHIAIGLTALGLSASCYLVYPPLQVLSIPLIVYLTRPLYAGTYKSLVKEKRITIDVLGSATFAIAFFKGYIIACSIATTTFGLRAKLLAKVKDDSRKNLIDIFKLQPRTVWVFVNGIEVEKPFEALECGDVVVVNAGETISVDGAIVDGMASVDQHILTGESRPVDKSIGDDVFALTTVLSGRIYVQVEKRGADTNVARIADILNQTVDFKTGHQLWAEDMTERTVTPALVASALSFPFIGPMGAATVLNSHFGYKLSAIAPISTLHFFSLASEHGILVKDGRTLEMLNQVDTVVFDKTGTLTQEQPHVGEIHTCSPYTCQEILAFAAAAESKQTHPIASAILQAAESRGLLIPHIDETEYQIGYGLTVSVDEQIVRVGSTRFMELQEIFIPSTVRTIQDTCHQQGNSLILVSINEHVAGAIELRATVRPEAKAIIQGLRQRGIQSIYIISGDHEAPTRNLAEELGIDHYFAEVMPEDKASLIEILQQEGKSVCFVGDGINDSIALKKAQASVSLSGASTIAIDTAQIILMNQSLSELCYLFDIARDLDANMKSTFRLILIPCLFSAGGAFFLHFGLLHSILLNQVALYSGLVNVMWPRLQHQSQRAKQLPIKPLPGKRDSDETADVLSDL